MKESYETLLFSFHINNKFNMSKLENLSSNLKRAVLAFPDRVGMSEQDRKIFFDIVGFAFNEGKISGKEELLLDSKKENENYEQKESKQEKT
jgi:hypothetical protein